MARITKGRLYKRGKKGNYYLQYYQEGKEHREALRDEHGEPIREAAAARAAADRILAPLRFKDDAQKLRTLVSELSALEKKTEDAAAALKNQSATLANGWECFLKCPTCPETYTRYGKQEPSYDSRAYISRGYYRNFVLWMEKHHPEVKLLCEVSEDIAQEYIDSLKKKYGTNGRPVNERLRVVKQVFFSMLEDEKIVMPRDPFKRIKRLKTFTTTKDALTIEEVQRLVSAAPDAEMRLLVLIGFCTGLRLGDCCTLQWGEVDLARRIISRIPNKMYDRVQNPESVRVKVGIPSLLMNEFLQIPADQRNGYVLPNLCEQYNNRHEGIYKRIRALFKSAKIVTVKPGSKDAQHPHGIIIKGFHSLRHTFVSLSAEAGAPQHVIQQIVGHSSPLMTMHYLHLGNSDLTRSAALIPELPMQDQQQTEATAETIDVSPVETEPEERAELHRLADTLTIEQIRTILANIPEA
jgi:integrase/recombinase XerD